MDLETLISGLGLTQLSGTEDHASVRVCDISEDSRTALPGTLFVARAGTRDLGARHIKSAVDQGAVAVVTDDPESDGLECGNAAVLFSPDAANIGALLAERFYGNPSTAMAIAGITGTNGKTTIAHLCQQIIKLAKFRCGLIGTVEVDDGRQRSSASMTTPPAIELSRTLATMVEHGCGACAMEVSSHALDQGRTFAIKIDAAGFTNLTGDHLDYHLSVEEYTRAKTKLFSSLDPGSAALINIDDASASAMINACAEGVDVMRCSMIDKDCDWFVNIASTSIDSMGLEIRSPIGSFSGSVPFFGSYNASNLLIAVGLCDVLLAKLGLNHSARIGIYQYALPQLRLPKGRLQRVDTEHDELCVLIDFAHSDDSIRSALDGARSVLAHGASLWCVFGCGGDRDRTKRPRMGQAACDGADRVVLTSDNPRSESPSEIVNDVLTGLDEQQRARVEVQVDRAHAIEFAIRGAKAGDVIVIAGKGHELEQIIADDTGNLIANRFDDAQHATIALEKRRSRVGVPE
ncbi:MAG: UDP-N-acetylmuramoyl-L-alanyl-D-glutamate--2,6-diaminopimelate ligase [Phycisphaerales bacterium]